MNDADILVEIAKRLDMDYTISKKGHVYTLTLYKSDDPDSGSMLTADYDEQGVVTRLNWC